MAQLLSLKFPAVELLEEEAELEVPEEVEFSVMVARRMEGVRIMSVGSSPSNFMEGQEEAVEEEEGSVEIVGSVERRDRRREDDEEVGAFS
jgi:hypothetical protein